MKKVALLFVAMFAFTVASAQTAKTTTTTTKTQPGMKDKTEMSTSTQSSTTAVSKNQDGSQTVTNQRATKKVSKKTGTAPKMSPDSKKMKDQEVMKTKSDASVSPSMKK